MVALQAFDAAARSLHFAQAAGELGVTPGAISRQIQQLETQLGIRLFDRAGHGVKLTEAGQIYAADVIDTLDRLAFASDRIRRRERQSPLSICAYPTFALRWLIPRWRQFADLNPTIDLQLTTSLTEVDPARDDFDAVIRVNTNDLTEHETIVLAPLEIFPVCSPSLSSAIRKPTDLAQHVMIRSASRPHDWKRWLSKSAGGGKPSTQSLVFESLSLAYQAAIEGVGVAMGVGCLVEDDLRLGRLIKPLSQSYRSHLSFCLAFHKSRANDPRLQALCAFLTSPNIR